MTTRFASPGDAYLMALGRLVYAVSAIEWIVLGDLNTLAEHLPPNLTVQQLAGKATGKIGRACEVALRDISHEETYAFIEVAVNVLGRASTIRNHALHARPATIGGRQALYRWVSDETHGRHFFPISAEWLEASLVELDALTCEIEGARVLGHP